MTENYTFLIFLSCNVFPAQPLQPMESETKAAVTGEILKKYLSIRQTTVNYGLIFLKVYMWEINASQHIRNVIYIYYSTLIIS